MVDTTDMATSTTVDPTDAAFHWTRGATGRVETGSLEVPLDHDAPNGATVTLDIARRRANDPEHRIGALLVNPGGPGFGGSGLAEDASFIYGDELLDRFDIIGWDPRGTGESTPFIDCIDTYDQYFGIETGPDTPAEEQQLRDASAAFAGGCLERSGDLLNHVSTVDAARDMDAIRAALGEETISYFGFSYGTRLGATWATMFPDTVRAAVLDGAMDPTVGRVQGLIDQAAGFDRTLSTFLEDCSSRRGCPFANGGDSAGAFAALLAQLEASPIATEPGRPPLNDGVFEVGVAQALYSEQSWPELARALAAAQLGDGVPMLDLYDTYYGRQPSGAYGNEYEAYFAITCADDPDTAGVDAAISQRAAFSAGSRIGFTIASELVVCASFAPVATERLAITAAGAGPIMVVGNTGDPATPYEGSRRMAETLEEGFFVSVDSNTHTAYGLNTCITTAIESYLIAPRAPDAELSC